MLGVMEQTSVVYGLRCVCHNDGYRYVGKTKHSLHDRLICHRYESGKNTTRPVYKWMRKHGAENIMADVLEHSATNETLCLREIYWIGFFSTHVSVGGLNVTLGGEGSLGVSGHIGERNPAATLTDEQVTAIKADIWAGMRSQDVRRKHGIPKYICDKIQAGATWKRIPWPLSPSQLVSGNSKLTYQQVVDIKVALRAGVPGRQLVREYNSSRNAISAINTGKTWKHVPWPEVVL